MHIDRPTYAQHPGVERDRGLDVADAEHQRIQAVDLQLNGQVLRRVDQWVREARQHNRSQAIEAAIASRLDRLELQRLIEACALLTPEEERILAEQDLVNSEAALPPT